ncbi:hypothetical protein [Nonomuraea deserti]|uniref:hypothetical protein n=1 Tax=Nonomuraea deserti TaxID=1848322 RepID=UPI001404C61C|nr:hypothetical protein [Nonomuraea deserti]
MADAGDPPGAPPPRWPGGVTALELTDAPQAVGARVSHHERLTDPALWGRAIEDERYVLITELIR